MNNSHKITQTIMNIAVFIVMPCMFIILFVIGFNILDGNVIVSDKLLLGSVVLSSLISSSIVGYMLYNYIKECLQ